MSNYIVSKKYSGKHHPFFTLWGPEDSGYVYAIESAGIYNTKRINKEKFYYNSENAIPVKNSSIKKYLVKYLVDDYICHVLPITPTTLRILGIEEKDLRGSGPVPQNRRFENIKDLTLLEMVDG